MSSMPRSGERLDSGESRTRIYLNEKRRCMQENCLVVGTYKELSKHDRSEHPFANPHEEDPSLQQKWRMLEHKGSFKM